MPGAPLRAYRSRASSFRRKRTVRPLFLDRNRLVDLGDVIFQNLVGLVERQLAVKDVAFREADLLLHVP